MGAVLVTGMSGAGKSTALAALRERGFEAVDTDQPGWIEIVGGEPLWRTAAVLALLDRPRGGTLFVGGTVRNQGGFADRFDAVVLLTAPIEVLLDRIRGRSDNDLGTVAAERDAVIRDHRETEPLLRATATHVIDTTAPRESVVDEPSRSPPADATSASSGRLGSPVGGGGARGVPSFRPGLWTTSDAAAAESAHWRHAATREASMQLQPHPIQLSDDDAERGDVPGWVLVTMMTAGLVVLLWGVAGPALTGLFNQAISSVSGL